MAKTDEERLETLRSWRRRSKGLARTGGPKRKTRIKASNPKRRKERYDRNYGERREWIVSRGCEIAGHPLHRCRYPLEAAHVDARGMGGAGGDRRKVVCLCRAAHDEAGERPGIGRWEGTKRAVFQEKYGIDLDARAEEIALEADMLGYP